MKFISIDIETTGLNPEQHQILEFGAIAADIGDHTPFNELPTFHRYIIHDSIVGQPYALQMNADILKRIALKTPGYKYCEPKDLMSEFRDWLSGIGYAANGSLSAAGKNFASFDLQFINKLQPEAHGIRFKHRVLDPAILYYQPGDKALPNLKTCKERAGITGDVTHNALDDALDVVKLIMFRLQEAPY